MADEWRWLDLGGVDGATMVNVFVALAGPVGARRSPPTVIALHPSAPFANVGFHQEAEREIDLEYCRAQGIPLVRRVVGGGAILDGPWEEDYMVVVPSGSPGTGEGVPPFYERYLAPIRSTLARLGVAAERSGVNDLAVEGRKISANGALMLDGSWILVGDILLDLDLDAMSRVLKVPDEKFRGKLAGGMAEWLTSVRARTGRRPEREEVDRLIREEFARSFDVRFVDRPLTDEESRSLRALVSERSQDAWTFQKDRAHPELRRTLAEGRAVKISHEAVLARADLKAGKLVRVTLLYGGGQVRAVQFSGDFFTQPFDGHLAELEATLVGRSLAEEGLTTAIEEWLRSRHVQLLGAAPSDLSRAILAAAALPVASS
jgi:lipoate---protein ligase